MTGDYLNEVLEYTDGKLSYRTRPDCHFINETESRRWNAQYSGNVAGHITTDSSGKSYRRLSIDSQRCFEHNVVWLMFRGEIPTGFEIDHINGDGTDNHLGNLRLTDRTGNNRNRRLFSTNKTGVSGISFCKSRNKYRCTIKNNEGKSEFKRFSDFFSAVCWRKSKENKYGYHENHGEVRPL